MMYVAILIPLRLSFIDDSAVGWEITDWIVSGLFFIDIFVNAASAYFDSNDNLITDKKVTYKAMFNLKGKFTIENI